MATKKTASKQSKKATLDFNLRNSDKPNKRQRQKTVKNIKKLGFSTIALALVFLAIGGAGGFFAVKMLTRNDCFTLNGKDEITLQIGETYTDEGVEVVAFGKDDSGTVEIKTDLVKNEDGTYTATEEGRYYMIYTVKNFKYGTLFKIQKIRLISFVEATEQDEIDNLNPGGNP